MKRVKAGYYIDNTGDWYAVRFETNRLKWSVGNMLNGRMNHVEDFRTYKAAKDFINNQIRVA